MAKQTRTERRRVRARQELAGKGWTAIVIGILLLTMVPAFLQGPIGNVLGQALRPLGWMALALGAILLGLHQLVDRDTAPKKAERAAVPRSLRSSATPASRQEPTFVPERSSAEEPAPPQEQQWSTAVLFAIEWRRFEALCEAFYAQAGFATRSQSHGPDGGVDIWLQSKHIVAPRIVQCKHWRNTRVALKDMREFLGVMASHKLQNGTFVTSSTFTREALAFAEANGIQAQDGAALLKLIRLRTPEQQAALLAVAYEGEYWRPTCAGCGTKMVERPPKGNRGAFWGCNNYRRCGAKPISKAKARVQPDHANGNKVPLTKRRWSLRLLRGD
ncbi:restriction endonuclease [Variovorax paradoxus]|nr:restriction endonuclease [Variovorax paradoxus]